MVELAEPGRSVEVAHALEEDHVHSLQEAEGNQDTALEDSEQVEEAAVQQGAEADSYTVAARLDRQDLMAGHALHKASVAAHFDLPGHRHQEHDLR